MRPFDLVAYIDNEELPSLRRYGLHRQFQDCDRDPHLADVASAHDHLDVHPAS